MLPNVATLSDPEQFRVAFQNYLMDKMHGTPDQTIRVPLSSGSAVGIRFAKSPEKFTFFKDDNDGHSDYTCAVYWQIELIRKAVFQIIQDGKRSVFLPGFTNKVAENPDATFCLWERATEELPGDEVLHPTKNCTPECTKRFHSLDLDLVERTSLNDTLKGIFIALGCEYTRGEKVPITISFEGGDRKTHASVPQVKISLPEKTFPFLFPAFEKVVLKGIWWPECTIAAYEKGEYTDFEIRTKEGSSLKVHKLVLCHVPYFKTLFGFSGKVKEQQENCLVLQTIALSSVKAALDFLYKGVNPFATNDHGIDALEVLDLSEQWVVPGLKQLAAIEIGTHAKYSQVGELRALSEKYTLPFLEKVAQYFEGKEASNSNGSGSGSAMTSAITPPAEKPKEVLPLDVD